MMGIIDMQFGRDDRSRRLSLLREFNVAGQEGADNWRTFISVAKRTGFNNDDFRTRLGLSAFQVRLQENGAQIPCEQLRSSYKKAVVGTLFGKLGFPDPNLEPA